MYEMKCQILPGQKPFIDIPPSTHIIWPVIYDDAGRQRNATRDETSDGSPSRPSGVRSYTFFRYSLSLSTQDKQNLLRILDLHMFSFTQKGSLQQNTWTNDTHDSKVKRLTCLTIEVLMYQGATALLLMLSFAHSHAKFLVS